MSYPLPGGVDVGATASLLDDALAARWAVIHAEYTHYEEPRPGMTWTPGDFMMVYLGWPGTRMGDGSLIPKALLRWHRPPVGDWTLACRVTLHTGRVDRLGDGILEHRLAYTPEVTAALLAEYAPREGP